MDIGDACTLPTAERPLRLTEFDDLFTSAVTGVDRVAAARLHLELTADPQVAARVADLVMRESACCAFFTFTLAIGEGRLGLDVTVPPAHTEILDALAAMAIDGRTP